MQYQLWLVEHRANHHYDHADRYANHPIQQLRYNSYQAPFTGLEYKHHKLYLVFSRFAKRVEWICRHVFGITSICYPHLMDGAGFALCKHRNGLPFVDALYIAVLLTIDYPKYIKFAREL